MGVGIGTPAQAAEVCAFADGVIVGSALMTRLVGGDVEGAIALATAFREAIPVLRHLRLPVWTYALAGTARRRLATVAAM